jgi:putative ABC transport system permease protein
MGSRRAMALWSWRLIRREWRQQALVVALVALAIGLASFFGVIFANTEGASSSQGSASHEIELFAGQAPLADQRRDIAAQFDPVAATEWHQRVRQKGSPYDFDLGDAISPTVFDGRPVAMLKGAAPIVAGEIALSDALMRKLGVAIGDTIDLTVGNYRVVGRYENPANLQIVQAIVAPGLVPEPTALHVLVRSDDAGVNAFEATAGRERLISHTTFSNRSQRRFLSTMLVYLMTAVAMVEIGLLSAAGFAVMARRRIREFGLLGAIGAKERQLRQAMALNGFFIGLLGGTIGVALGFGSSLAFQPLVERIVGARIGFWGIPWSGIVPFVGLAALTSMLAAWWPARSISRASIVASIAARRPLARPVRRTALVGIGAVLVGAVVHSRSVASLTYVVAAVSIAVALIGMLLLAPAAIARIGSLSARLPLPFRIAGRDLARHQGRSAAALASLTLALGIPVGMTLAATSADASVNRPSDNLPVDIAVVNVAHGTSASGQSALPPRDFDVASVASELAALVEAIPGGKLVPVMAAADPTVEDQEVTYAGGVTVSERAVLRVSRPNGPANAEGLRGYSIFQYPAWIATRELLNALHLDERLSDSTAELIGAPDASIIVGSEDAPYVAQNIEPLGLGRFGSIAPYWVPPGWVAAHHFEPTLNGWLVVAPAPITAAHRFALRVAAGNALTVETRVARESSASIRRTALAVGTVVGLAILAVIVSLIRSEAADEHYTLAAVGAPRRARRSISAATAALLAGTAGLLAVPTGYLALVGLMSNPTAKQGFVLPLDVLAAVVFGFPLVATLGAWLVTRPAAERSQRRIV